MNTDSKEMTRKALLRKAAAAAILAPAALRVSMLWRELRVAVARQLGPLVSRRGLPGEGRGSAV